MNIVFKIKEKNLDDIETIIKKIEKISESINSGKINEIEVS